MAKRRGHGRNLAQSTARGREALEIDEADWWWFRELYSVLSAFADKPEYVISRIGGGSISIPEDQANDLAHFRQCVLEKYPAAAELALMEVVERIDAILTRKSAGGDLYEKGFWTNAGFMRSTDWAEIREIARGFLLH